MRFSIGPKEFSYATLRHTSAPLPILPTLSSSAHFLRMLLQTGHLYLQLPGSYVRDIQSQWSQ
ncbi:hypothetical protein Gohar_020592 [Gossypium harknessii]|uniref:Uncharacterized protein n=1 Tax=Gossypium harknessii TaxID=34285 RepID=A0A7J9HY41_9ROSI|nr:hypothetical protein [Gossypium harknessii]